MTNTALATDPGDENPSSGWKPLTGDDLMGAYIREQTRDHPSSSIPLVASYTATGYAALLEDAYQRGREEQWADTEPYVQALEAQVRDLNTALEQRDLGEHPDLDTFTITRQGRE